MIIIEGDMLGLAASNFAATIVHVCNLNILKYMNIIVSVPDGNARRPLKPGYPVESGRWSALRWRILPPPPPGPSKGDASAAGRGDKSHNYWYKSRNICHCSVGN